MLSLQEEDKVTSCLKVKRAAASKPFGNESIHHFETRVQDTVCNACIVNKKERVVYVLSNDMCNNPSCRIQLPACTSSVTRPIVFVSPFTPPPAWLFSLCFVSSMYFARAFGKASTNALRAQRANARLISRVASPAVAVKGNCTPTHLYFTQFRGSNVVFFSSARGYATEASTGQIR